MRAALAVLLVAAAGAALPALGVGLRRWTAWLWRTGGALAGIIGLVLIGAAAANLGVPRACETTSLGDVVVRERDRPIVSIVTGSNECRTEGLAQVELAGLAGMGASAGVIWRRQAESAAS